MISLIKRSIIIQKTSMIINILYLVLILLFIDSIADNNGIFFLLIPGMVYISTFMVEQYDSFFNYHCILNSMAVTRKEIIDSKYLIGIISYIINLIVALVAYKIFITFDLIPNSITDIRSGILISIFISSLYISIGLPISVIFPYRKAKIINVIFFVFTFNISMGIKNILTHTGFSLISIIAMFLGIIILFFSRMISIKYYNKKDF